MDEAKTPLFTKALSVFIIKVLFYRFKRSDANEMRLSQTKKSIPRID